MTRILSQIRAGHALAAIEEFGQAAPRSRRYYLPAIKSLPVVIRMNGLGQAMAMALSQGARQTDGGAERRVAHKAIYEHLQSWLCRDDVGVFSAADMGQVEGARLMHALCSAGQATYLSAQVEALAYAAWLKKFANAFLSETETPQIAGDQP